jgi:hypothetical protein
MQEWRGRRRSDMTQGANEPSRNGHLRTGPQSEASLRTPRPHTASGENVVNTREICYAPGTTRPHTHQTSPVVHSNTARSHPSTPLPAPLHLGTNPQIFDHRNFKHKSDAYQHMGRIKKTRKSVDPGREHLIPSSASNSQNNLPSLSSNSLTPIPGMIHLSAPQSVTDMEGDCNVHSILSSVNIDKRKVPYHSSPQPQSFNVLTTQRQSSVHTGSEVPSTSTHLVIRSREPPAGPFAYQISPPSVDRDVDGSRSTAALVATNTPVPTPGDNQQESIRVPNTRKSRPTTSPQKLKKTREPRKSCGRSRESNLPPPQSDSQDKCPPPCSRTLARDRTGDEPSLNVPQLVTDIDGDHIMDVVPSNVNGRKKIPQNASSQCSPSNSLPNLLPDGSVTRNIDVPIVSQTSTARGDHEMSISTDPSTVIEPVMKKRKAKAVAAVPRKRRKTSDETEAKTIKKANAGDGTVVKKVKKAKTLGMYPRLDYWR